MRVPPAWLRAALALWGRVEHWPPVTFCVDCFTVFMRIEGRDRVLMLAGQGFIALVPAMVVLASFTSASGAGRVGDVIIERMQLTDSAADAVSTLFAYPPGATGGITLFSFGLLLFSLNGFARSVQRTFEGAWGLPKVGMRGTGSRTLGLLVLLGAGVLAARVGGLLGQVPFAGFALGLAAQAAVIVVGWIVGTALMLSRRTPARTLVRGALLSAPLQLVVGWCTAIYIPEIFARNAERYGVVGVALALVTWLIAVASLIVGGAVLGAVLGVHDDPVPSPGAAEVPL